MSGKVFVSYSQADRECAYALVARLESAGIGCWIAPRDLSPSADWAAEIIDAIAAAGLMVLVFSSSSNDSQQVRREVERAVHKQLKILPFRIEDVLPSKSLEYFLSSQHWMDAFPGPLLPHVERLCAYLQTRTESAAPSAAVTARSAAITASSAAITAPHLRAADPGAVAGDDLRGRDLRPIELQLARHIGPLARHLVRQAARFANGQEDFIARLAAEIDAPRDRTAFERNCRQTLQDSGPG